MTASSAAIRRFAARRRISWQRLRRILGRGLVVGALFLALILPRADRYVLTPAEEAAVENRFSLVTWEVRNALSKWTARVARLFMGISTEEGARLVERYATINEQLRGLEGDLVRAASQRGADLAGDSKITDLEARIGGMQAERRAMRGRLEEYLESELSTTLAEQRLGKFGPLLWPPVDFRMEEPPQILVVSRRDRIERLEDVLLESDTKTTRAEAIEQQILQRENLSAVIEGLGGLATYPNIVPSDYDLLPLLQVAAHEWLHSYLFFRPLGQNFNTSREMATLNETLASLAGDELGGATWARLTGRAAPVPELLAERVPPGAGSEFSFGDFMRATRLRTDELLAQGQIEAAEEYMEQRRVELQAHGYFLRKLNQAYFAFHGTYADSPASTSPIGPQVAEFHRLSRDIGETVREIGSAGSYEEFLRILERKRAATAQQ